MSAAGTYGTFTLAANGAWTYTANDSQTAIQQLGAGQSITDSFSAVAYDGSQPASQVVTVTINGTNDAPVIGGVSTGAVTEDNGSDLDFAGEAYRLYETVLNRSPDVPGIEDWTSALMAGMDLQTAALGFIDSAEFQASSGALDNSQFLTLLYEQCAAPGSRSCWICILAGCIRQRHPPPGRCRRLLREC